MAWRSNPHGGLCERIVALRGLRERVMTTDGSQRVKPLNISLDSLDVAKFHAITRSGQLQQVLDTHPAISRCLMPSVRHCSASRCATNSSGG